eukprot:Platyproteum_vivax@DN6167_c0_g1_i2.p1
MICDPGWRILSVDYGQIELRVAAHLSGDSQLLEIFEASQTTDVFMMMASLWLQKDVEDVTAAERAGAKNLVYALLYGAGASLVASKLQCSLHAAGSFIRMFNGQFPAVQRFISACKLQAEQFGGVPTLFGRWRCLPNAMLNDNPAEKMKALRQAVNGLCQASAADIAKLAMTRVHHALNKRSAYKVHKKKCDRLDGCSCPVMGR